MARAIPDRELCSPASSFYFAIRFYWLDPCRCWGCDAKGTRSSGAFVRRLPCRCASTPERGHISQKTASSDQKPEDAKDVVVEQA